MRRGVEGKVIYIDTTDVRKGHQVVIEFTKEGFSFFAFVNPMDFYLKCELKATAPPTYLIDRTTG